MQLGHTALMVALHTTLFRSLVQAEATDDPAAHMEQTLGAVEPAGQKLLAGHKICTEALGQ